MCEELEGRMDGKLGRGRAEVGWDHSQPCFSSSRGRIATMCSCTGTAMPLGSVLSPAAFTSVCRTIGLQEMQERYP